MEQTLGGNTITLRHSAPGIASFAISVLVVGALALAVALSAGSRAPAHMTMVVALAAIGGLAMTITGAGLGTAGVLERGCKRSLALAGLLLNAAGIVALVMLLP